MILIDTSAWVEFLRSTGSPACERVDALLDSHIATCDPVRMEILAGARNCGDTLLFTPFPTATKIA